ncbi:MAG: hypothetical protein WC376_03210 [Candidatus Nanoarchaeia archaeon]|jgi:mevalonate kinase
MNAETITPGRICLLGDKVDLLNKPVIAAAINKTLRINISKLDNKILYESRGLAKTYEMKLGAKYSDNNFNYQNAIYDLLKDRIKGGFICNDSTNIPIGAGVSSSAAISVGFARALNLEYGLGLSDYEIAEIAYRAEHDVLGISCGRMDQYSIAFGGVTFIDTLKPNVERLSIGSLPIIVANSNQPRSAKIVLNETMSLINKGNDKILNCFDRVYQGVLAGKKALQNNDFKTFGELMNLQQGIENEFNELLSTPSATPKLNLLCETAINAGAIGAKQMGAGGGGCMIALCPENKEKIAKELEKNGATVYSCDIFNY